MRDRFLLVESGPHAGERYPIEGADRLVLGRGQKSALRLGDPGLSREHFAIETRADETWIVDLESKNGTSVNGIPVESRRLAAGDRIAAGQTTLLYVEEDRPAARGDLSLEDGGEISETLSISAETFLAARAAAGAGLERRLLGALYRIGSIAQEASALDPFFAQVLGALHESEVLVEGAIALFEPGAERPVDPASARSQVEPRGGVTFPPGTRFVLPSGLLEGVLARQGVVGFTDANPGGLIGVPLWIDRAIGGILGLRLPEAAGEAPRRVLELFAILGSLAGGSAGAVRRLASLERESVVLRSGAQARHDMVGRSAAMRRVFQLIDKIAPTDASVLIRGESGTGKELVARAIHYRSAVAGGPFVPVNAAALPVDLVESDLFGHEKGAFTGAVAAKQGRFELADGGTFFLDEVADLDLRVQAKFLRVLEDGTFQRVGGTRTIRARARVLAATNQDLAVKVRDGAFREDLFYRLRVIELVLPPLRERPQDVELLSRHFLARFGEEMGRRRVEFSPEALEVLRNHPWPGNVRELKNTIERALVLAGSGPIEPAHFGLGSARVSDDRELPTLVEVERDHIRRVLEATGGNKSQAARMLGIDRSTLYEKIKAMGGV